MSEIEYRVELMGERYANLVGPSELVAAMYHNQWQSETIVGDSVYRDGVELTPINGVLDFDEVPGEDKTAIYGNTVTRLCPVAEDCGSCALSGAGLSFKELSLTNCARANTALTFAEIDQEPEGRFVLLPLGKESFVVDDESFVSEYNGDELMQHRLAKAPAVVFTESWIRSQGLNKISIGMNGADGSFGVAITEVDGERLIIPFCSMRQNMGDRDEEDQILRQALLAYLDSKDYSEEDRERIISGLKVSIDISASASLANFAHKIQIPDEGNPYRERLIEKYPELIAAAGGKITPRIVLHDQYAGALERGALYPELEAQLGEQSDPFSPAACPLDGQTCHVDYRSETRYALRKQLEEMGVSPENIQYDDSQALDPADPNNDMASNRAEQNKGVEVSKTNRTINGMKIRLVS